MPSQGDIRHADRFRARSQLPEPELKRLTKQRRDELFEAQKADAVNRILGVLPGNWDMGLNPETTAANVGSREREWRNLHDTNKNPYVQYAAGGPVDPYTARGIDFNKMYGGFNPDLAKSNIDPRVAALLTNKNRVPMASGGAVMGRGGDNMLGVNRNLPGGAVHLSDAEAGILRSLAPQVGGLTVNPHTGLPEAFKLRDLIPWLAPVAMNAAIPWASNWADGSGGIMDMLGRGAQWLGTSEWGPMTQGALTGALTGLATGNMMQGIGSGVMSYGLQKQFGPSLMRSMGPNVRTPSNSFQIPNTESGLEWSGPDENLSGYEASGFDPGGAGVYTAGHPNTFASLADKINYKNSDKYPGGLLALMGAGVTALDQSDLGKPRGGVPSSADLQRQNYLWNYGVARQDPDGNRKWTIKKGRGLQRPAGMAGGGIVSLMGGGGITAGMGDGTSDQIPAMIGAASPMQQPQPAALSPGEFVVPADVVSGLGNGDTGAGASALQNMMAKVRQTRTGMPRQPRDVNLNRVMPV